MKISWKMSLEVMAADVHIQHDDFCHWYHVSGWEQKIIKEIVIMIETFSIT